MMTSVLPEWLFRRLLVPSVFVSTVMLNTCVVLSVEIDDSLKDVLQADQRENPGTVAKAWKRLAEQPAGKIPRLLIAMNQAGPLSANWLRSAVDAIAERSLREEGELPVAELERFVLETEHDPRARRQAFEWLARVDTTAHDRLIPEMLNDPSVELRREAVAHHADRARQLEEQGKEDAAKVAYQTALSAARDEDQVRQLAQRLKNLGTKVDLPRHFGFLQKWHVVGPFDNTDRKGFAAVYEPEHGVDLEAEYKGKEGVVRWQSFQTDHDFGMVDLNQPLGSKKDAVAYALNEFESTESQKVELRLGCKNAWKIWLNGDLVFAREEYHRGMKMDQYRFPVTLKTGTNQILVKACQNEQVETWTVEWQFQLRICDATGTAILSD